MKKAIKRLKCGLTVAAGHSSPNLTDSPRELTSKVSF